jgi:isopentenyl-diphosphate delta-isomerase type 1
MTSLAAGYARCAEITREFGTTYWWGARLLPQDRRRHVHAVYALARLADDIVDEPGHASVEASAAALAAFEKRVWAACQSGTSPDPVLAAVAMTLHECAIPDEAVERFFAAMRRDLSQATYETWEDLLGYMDGSAAVIGEMMLPILGAPEPAREAARALGLAFQLTNFLRDVGEDLDRGRVYLPQEDLREHGADPHLRLVTPEWRALMREQVERNRRLYREADCGIPLMPVRSQRCVATARILYAQILEQIEAADYDVFTERRRVPTPAKAALAARMVIARDPMRRVLADRAARTPDLGWVADDEVVLVDEAGMPSGSARKSAVHHDATRLHLAFSCHLLAPDGSVLVTTRAASKPSFPGVVTNSVCGHPQPGEALEDAVRRRVASELGVMLRPEQLRLVLPGFRYRARMRGIVENELCPVFVALVDDTTVTPDPDEVDEAHWEAWVPLRDGVLAGLRTVSPWYAEQIAFLADLGDDPRAWPAASVDGLPAAARKAG